MCFEPTVVVYDDAAAFSGESDRRQQQQGGPKGSGQVMEKFPVVSGVAAAPPPPAGSASSSTSGPVSAAGTLHSQLVGAPSGAGANLVPAGAAALPGVFHGVFGAAGAPTNTAGNEWPYHYQGRLSFCAFEFSVPSQRPLNKCLI